MLLVFKAIFFCIFLAYFHGVKGSQAPLKFEHAIHGFNQYRSFIKNETTASKLHEFETILKLNPNSESILKKTLTDFAYTDFRSISNNVSEACLEQIEYFGLSLKAKEFWTFEVIDSFAKLPSGILRGHLTWLGQFSECRNITSGNFTGQYVMLSKAPNLNDMFRNGGVVNIFSILYFFLTLPYSHIKRDV